ncbi:MAG TPA: glycoside hydrolase family 88 protein, partial [Polyangiales bacterium]|nr:glycoside hydrolase family 88 protein [Polyangiales bacterium]
ELAWSWGEGVLAYGLWRLHERLGDPEPRAYLAAYVRRHQRRAVRVSWSDDTTPGLTAAELVLAGDPSVRLVLDRVVGYAMTAPRTEAQGLVRHLGQHIPVWLTPRAWFPDAWVDSLFHFPITLCRYSRLTGDGRYRDEAARQVAVFLRNLQDPATGFVTHAYNDRPRDERVPAFARRAFWARGNGWALVSLVEVIQELPDDHALRAELVARSQRLASALAVAQSADGLFHTVLLEPETYLETAASGLITYAFATGARAGLFDASFRAAAERGMRGLTGTLEQRGDRLEVSGTSLGTNPSARARGYARIGRANQVSYGVGAWLLAASALL